MKDAERGPLNYLGGYILHNLYRKHQSKASKKTNICQGKEEFLLNSLHIDEPVAKDAVFINAKDRGGLWCPKEYLTDILAQQKYSFVSILGRRSVTKSVWTRLSTYFSDLSGTCWWRSVGVRSQKEDIFFFFLDFFS